jgi:hypothetical protein
MMGDSETPDYEWWGNSFIKWTGAEFRQVGMISLYPSTNHWVASCGGQTKDFIDPDTARAWVIAIARMS